MIISFSSLIILPNIVFRKKTDYYYLIILPYIYHLIFISFPEKKKTHHLPHFNLRTKIPDLPGLDPIRWLPQGGRDGVGALSDG